MKLNPKKCSFGIEEGPFLGHLIIKQGIRSNPSKVKVVTDLEPSKTLKDIQSLNGKLAALIRFLSKGAEKSLPFFKTLKSCTNEKTIQWTMDAEEAFQKMKRFMEILPTLTALIKGEVLVMYLAASTESISAALLAKREGKQVPIYFVSRVLQGSELNYPALEKLILALVHAARMLRRERSSTQKKIPKDFLVEMPSEENERETKTKKIQNWKTHGSSILMEPQVLMAQEQD
ncbi:reverse transcriptase domain-containing protein [Tanacetum coccineum]